MKPEDMDMDLDVGNGSVLSKRYGRLNTKRQKTVMFQETSCQMTPITQEKGFTSIRRSKE